MVTKVIMLKLAANVEEATVGRWFKNEGEPVESGEPLFEAITDKAALEVPAEGSGILRKILAPANSVVPVGQVIAVIAEPDEELPDVEPARAKARAAAPRSIKASFGARRLARELGVDLAALVPSRPDGRITEEDVRRVAAAAEGPPVLERIPLSPLKRAVAEHLSRTTHKVAAAFVTLEADFSAVQAALPALSHQAGVPVLSRDVVLHAAACRLPEHRLLNACFSDDAILLYEPVNIGLAVDIERDDSVVVPVLRDADQRLVGELAREAAALVERVRNHAPDPADLADATFTFIDQSGLGIDNFVPILNDRQSAILAMSSVRQRPVLRGDELAIAPLANLAVAFDHRVLNATAAARFLHAVRDAVENFAAPETA